MKAHITDYYCGSLKQEDIPGCVEWVQVDDMTADIEIEGIESIREISAMEILFMLENRDRFYIKSNEYSKIVIE